MPGKDNVYGRPFHSQLYLLDFPVLKESLRFVISPHDEPINPKEFASCRSQGLDCGLTDRRETVHLWLHRHLSL